jgi:hypothetical protein
MVSRGNIYHILAMRPKLHAHELPIILEGFAQQLVQSGRLYINADTMRNFVHFTTANGTVSLSARELNDPDKMEDTAAMVARSVPKGLGAVAVNVRLDQLQNELKKARGIDAAVEIRVARLIVQAAHPAVIASLLHENTQVFVSFSHNVGDLMAVHFWQDRGTASGLQATDEQGAQVYVSCGGNPFFAGEDDEKYYATDGFDSLARMLVIAGQELGHFADIRRSKAQGFAGRHSADMGARLAPSAICKTGRDADMQHVKRLQQAFENAAAAKLLRAEAAVAFYDERLKFSLVWCMRQAMRFWHYVQFRAKFPSLLPPYHRTHPPLRMGAFYAQMLADMDFNLSPDADAYRRDDPVEEEAIACIEALARVPQQANKWGHSATKTCWPKLYTLYYGQVIPDLRVHLPAYYQQKIQAIRPPGRLQQAFRRWKSKI